MAQNIGKRRGKSPIKTRLEQERKAARKDPKGKKAFTKGLSTAANLTLNLSAVGPTVRGVGVAVKGYKKYKKIKNTQSIALYRGEPGYKTFTQTRKKLKKNPNTGKFFTTEKDTALQYSKQPLKPFSKGPNKFGILKKVKVSPNEFKAMKKGKLKDTRVNRGSLKYFNKDYFYGTVSPEVRRRANVISKSKSGGLTDTVPPKRGPKPQGYRKGADVDFFAAGNEDFQYGGGKASYTFDGKKSSITPSLSGSAYKVKGKSLKGKFDRVGLKVSHKPNKKVNLKGEVSRNVHGKKDYRGMIAAEYKKNNKEFKAGIDHTGKVNLNFKMGFKHGGCPHREIGVKSDIKGISGIQLKGQKFIGNK